MGNPAAKPKSPELAVACVINKLKAGKQGHKTHAKQVG